MKKLIAIGLMMLSTLAFAETVTPDLLVGKWQCDFNFYNTETQNTIQQNSLFNFKKNGLYEGKTQIHTFKNSQPVVIDMEVIGKYRIQNGNFATNIEKLIEVHSTNKDLSDFYHTNAWREFAKKFHDSKILNLSRNSFVITMTDEENQNHETASLQTCHHIQ